MLPALSSLPTLPLAERGNLIFNQGKYLAVREYYGFFINLYLLEDTFVEIWYSRSRNEIDKIELLEDLRKIDLYIFSMLNLVMIEGERKRMELNRLKPE